MADKPLILVTNDDGITAPGLRTHIHVMNKIGEVVVGAIWSEPELLPGGLRV